MSAHAVVCASSLAYHLEGKTILENIDLEVKPGELVGIIGPNGAGKTSLLRLLLGLAEPCRGAVKVFGMRPAALGKRRDAIGYMPQRPPASRNLPLSVLDAVAMGLVTGGRLGKPLGKNLRQNARESLAKVGLLHLRDRPFAHLSGGQQQRAFLARALVKSPSLLFLDEPNAGLDLPTQNRFMSLLNELQQEDGLTVVMVSHDLSAIAVQAERLYCINRSMHAHGRPAEVLNNPRLGEAYRCEFEMLFGRERSFRG